MRSVQTSEGMSGVARYAADAVHDPRLEFDTILKLASRRAILFGDAGRLDDAFDYLDQAIAACDPSLVYLSIAPHWALSDDPCQPSRARFGPYFCASWRFSDRTAAASPTLVEFRAPLRSIYYRGS